MAGQGRGGGRRKGDKNNRGRGGKTPEQFMNQLVAASVDERTVEAELVDYPLGKDWIDPVDFCRAVINGDSFTLQKCGVAEIPNLDQKLEAAKIAVRYTNKAKPVETVSKHQFSWIDEISDAEQRVQSLRMDVEDGAADAIN